jgi:DNA-directed RNA polymerase subunit RPC12/RpoP
MCPKCGSHQVVKIGDNHSGLIFSSGKQAETYYQCKNCYHKWIEHR